MELIPKKKRWWGNKLLIRSFFILSEFQLLTNIDDLNRWNNYTTRDVINPKNQTWSCLANGRKKFGIRKIEITITKSQNIKIYEYKYYYNWILKIVISISTKLQKKKKKFEANGVKIFTLVSQIFTENSLNFQI